jgi:hypothetical protein
MPQPSQFTPPQLDDEYLADNRPDFPGEALLIAAVLTQAIHDARRWPQGFHAWWVIDGTELRELAALVGLDPEQVHRRALEAVDRRSTMGTPKRHKRQVCTKARVSRVSPHREAIEALASQGLNARQIARQLGISLYPVYNALPPGFFRPGAPRKHRS